MQEFNYEVFGLFLLNFFIGLAGGIFAAIYLTKFGSFIGCWIKLRNHKESPICR